MYNVMLWDRTTRRYEVHQAFRTIEQAQQFVFVNLGYAVHNPEHVTVYYAECWDGSIKMCILNPNNDESWDDMTVAFIEKVG